MTTEKDVILEGLDDQERVSDLCIRCGKLVVPDNDSGWEAFVVGGTRPICSDCEDAHAAETQKGLEEMVKARNEQ